VRLIDFGASHRMGTRRETFRHWQGTPMFASSAQLNGEGRVETRDDWYSLNKIIEQVMPLERDYTRRTELERLAQRLCT
jgi:serine/threonine protein kinase